MLSKLLHSPLRKKQQGQAAIELVMSLLLFVMMLGSLLSLSMYMYVHHAFLTAAREGARTAAAEILLGDVSTWATGEQNVQDRVDEFISNSTGMQLNQDTDIIVEGPTPNPSGEQIVTVTVSHDFENPVQIRTFIDRLSGGSAEGLDTFTISDSATMRYEE